MTVHVDNQQSSPTAQLDMPRTEGTGHPGIRREQLKGTLTSFGALLPVGLNQIRLGVGFDSITGEIRAPGVKWAAGPPPDLPPQDLHFGQLFVSRNTIEEAVTEMESAGAAATFGYGAFKGSASISRSMSRKTSQRKEVLIVDARHYATTQLMDSTLLQPVVSDKELRKLGPAGFYKQFGDKYVIGIASGARLVGRFETMVSSIEEQETITKSLQAAGSYMAGNGEGKFDENEARHVAKSLAQTTIQIEERAGFRDPFSSDPQKFFLEALSVPAQASKSPVGLYWILSSYADIPQYRQYLLQSMTDPQLASHLRYMLKLYRLIASLNEVRAMPDPTLVIGTFNPTLLTSMEDVANNAIDDVSADVKDCMEELASSLKKTGKTKRCPPIKRDTVPEIQLLPYIVLIDAYSSAVTEISVPIRTQPNDTVFGVAGHFYWHYPKPNWFGGPEAVEIQLAKLDGTVVNKPFRYKGPFKVPPKARIFIRVVDDNYVANAPKEGDPLRAIFFRALAPENYTYPAGFTDTDFDSLLRASH